MTVHRCACICLPTKVHLRRSAGNRRSRSVSFLRKRIKATHVRTAELVMFNIRTAWVADMLYSTFISSCCHSSCSRPPMLARSHQCTSFAGEMIYRTTFTGLCKQKGKSCEQQKTHTRGEAGWLAATSRPETPSSICCRGFQHQHPSYPSYPYTS